MSKISQINKSKNRRGLATIKKIGFSPISKTVLVLNALILILLFTTVKAVFVFLFTRKIKTNYSKHIKQAIKVWQGP